jgi:hypothetical protein
MRIGTIKKALRQRINFKTWISKYWKPEQEYRFKVIRIFLPSRFNNITLVLLDEVNNLEITRTLNMEIGKALLKNFGFSIKKFNQFVLFVVIDREGNQDVVSEQSETEGYEYRNNCFVLTKIQDKTELEEDLPL